MTLAAMKLPEVDVSNCPASLNEGIAVLRDMAQADPVEIFGKTVREHKVRAEMLDTVLERLPYRCVDMLALARDYPAEAKLLEQLVKDASFNIRVWRALTAIVLSESDIDNNDPAVARARELLAEQGAIEAKKLSPAVLAEYADESTGEAVSLDTWLAQHDASCN